MFREKCLVASQDYSPRGTSARPGLYTAGKMLEHRRFASNAQLGTGTFMFSPRTTCLGIACILRTVAETFYRCFLRLQLAKTLTPSENSPLKKARVSSKHNEVSIPWKQSHSCGHKQSEMEDCEAWREARDASQVLVLPRKSVTHVRV